MSTVSVPFQFHLLSAEPVRFLRLPLSPDIKYNIHMKYVLIAIIIIIPLIMTAALIAGMIYKKTFYVRMAEPTGFIPFYFGEHPELHHEAFSCRSDVGTDIKGLLLIPDDQPEALIVMTHGYNMSCENYMPLAHRFCDSGFEILMFDGTGCGISGGPWIYGLPQHIPDMKSVLDAVSKDERLSSLPLLLFGHSWGGYAACCVSLLSAYPVKGILTCGAFRKSLSSMIPSMKRRFHAAAPLLIKAAEILEKLLFGKAASFTSSEGLRTAGCPARLYHSRDDAVVGYEESFETMKKELSDLENISFIGLDGRNHDLYLPPENDRRQREIRKELKSAKDPVKAVLLKDELWSLMSETDEDLAQEFIGFFKECIS